MTTAASASPWGRSSGSALFVVFAVLVLFYAATVGWSLGAVVSSLLTAATLVFAREGMRANTRMERIGIFVWLFWGLSYVSNLIEAVYFHVIPVRDAERSITGGLVLALMVACVLEWLMPDRSREREHTYVESAPHLWWRVPLLAFLFFVIYLLAGIAVYPWVSAFYQGRPLPSLGQLFVLQMFRGILDISCIFPLLRRWTHSRWRAGWISACVFVVLCGWGPLLLPNAFLPAPIRLAHAIEMGASGLVFGLIAARLLLKSKSLLPEESAPPDSSALPAPSR